MTIPAFCPYLALPCTHSRLQGANSLSIARRPRALTPKTPSSSETKRLQSSKPLSLFKKRSQETTLTRARSPPPSSSPTSSPSSPSPSHSPTPSPQGPQGNRSPDFHANVGSVIDTLRADYPHMLTQVPDLSMFCDDVVLSDGKGNRLVGKDAYRTVLFLLRAHARLFLTSASLHVLSMYYQDDTRPAIHMRWRMRASPRVWASANRDTPAIVDGLSIYYLDYRGHVMHHAFETRVRNGPTVVRPVFQHVSPVGNIAVETGLHLPRRVEANEVAAPTASSGPSYSSWVVLPLPAYFKLAQHMHPITPQEDENPTLSATEDFKDFLDGPPGRLESSCAL